jgi:hypothetical protein
MIRKIRQRHRVIWVISAVLLLVLFTASIIFRHTEPTNENVPKRNSSANK